MNFTGPGDFIYVTGDLSSIEIDNDIMPVRSGDAKYHLRGMDVAFLMEAVEERARALNMPGRTYEFNRSISLSQINAIVVRCNEIAVRQNADKWLNDFLYFTSGDVTDLVDFEKFQDTTRWNWQRYDYVEASEIEYVSDVNLVSEKILELFDFVRSLNRIITRPEYYDYSGRTYVSTGSQEAVDYALKSYIEPELWREMDTGAIGGRAELTATGQNLKLKSEHKSVFCGGYVQGKLSMGFDCSFLKDYETVFHTVDIFNDGSIPFQFQAEGMNFIKAERIVNDFAIPGYSRPIYELRDRTRWDV